MKRLLVFFFMYVFVFQLFSQNEITSNEHRKYWYYKHRLHDKFINLEMHSDPSGSGSLVDCDRLGGNNIPAARYNGTDLYYHEDNLLWHGMYIGVLATEYRLLKNNGENTQADETLEELYKAMITYERLDARSSSLPYPFGLSTPSFATCPEGSVVDGFFIRGDIGEPHYYDDYSYTAAEDCDGDGETGEEEYDANCSYDVYPGGQTEPGVAGALRNVYPDFYARNNYIGVHHDPTMAYFTQLKCCEKRKENDSFLENKLGVSTNTDRWAGMNFYPSQDQIASLFTGFALVKKCVSSNVEYDGYYNFYEKAQFYTNQITTYLKNNEWEGRLPDINNTPYRHGGTFRDELGYGLGRAARKITGESYIGSGDLTQLSVSKLYWDQMHSVPTPGFYTLLSVFAAKKNFHTSLAQTYMALAGEPLSGLALAELGLATDQGIYALLHAYLNEKSVKVPLGKNYFKSRIEDAPCSGPYYYPDDKGVEDWRKENRWWHPERNEHTEEFEDGTAGKTGEFNGLDYMFLFNLYNLVYPDEAYSNYRNVYYDNITFSGPIPTVNTTFCGKPYSYLSFNDITFDNAWLRDGIHVTFKAQNSIHFEPGFSTGSFCGGSSYQFVIGDVDCSDNPTQYFRQAQPTEEETTKEKAEEEIISKTIRVYPNPTKGTFTIDGIGSNATIEIADVYGRKVQEQLFDSERNRTASIDISSQYSGVYFINIITENNREVHRVTKN